MLTAGSALHHRQHEREGRAFADFALDGDRALVGIGDLLDDGETEACFADVPGSGLIDTIESLEEMGKMLRSDPVARIRHRYSHLIGRPAQPDHHPSPRVC